MKQIKAIIQPFMKEKVLAALWQVEGLPGITVSDVIGCGKRPSWGLFGVKPASEATGEGSVGLT